MEQIILITGDVKHTITIDPTVWIFDDRKVDLDTYFSTTENKDDELTKYKKEVSAHWDRELLEGATPPSEQQSKKTIKESVLTGSFGMQLKPFLENAEPTDTATSVLIETKNPEEMIELPLTEAKELILAFSQKGKPLREDGPVHLYFGNGSNQKEPIKNVVRFIVK